MPAHKLSHSVLLLVSFLTFTNALVLMLNVEAQQPCPDIPRNNFPKWRAGATVTVYFDENYQWSENVVSAITRAFIFGLLPGKRMARA